MMHGQKNIKLYIYIYIYIYRIDISLGIATGYRLDGSGFEPRWGASFSAPVQTDRPRGPSDLLYSGYRDLFLACKVAGMWQLPPTILGASIPPAPPMALIW